MTVRTRHEMPDDVRNALKKAGLRKVYDGRPPYQRNDYIGWITKVKTPETRAAHIDQMLAELKRGDVYMKMDWNGQGKENGPMTNRDGTPIWYELITDAPELAEEFYGKVMGWKFLRPQGGLERDYRLFNAPDGEGIGGVMKAPDGAAFAPIWAVYFGVSDVDAMAAKVEHLGGSIHMKPQDIPGVGRFAFVADPQGAIFYLMREDGDKNSTAFAPMKSGHCSWNELVTSDQDAALDFYSKLFGWQKTGAMRMGDMGDYTFIGQNKDDMIGAMMNARDKSATSFWNFAFTVSDIDVAKAAIEAGGGKIAQGPIELPGDQGDWVIQADDPQGAKVMFTGKRNQKAM